VERNITPRPKNYCKRDLACIENVSFPFSRHGDPASGRAKRVGLVRAKKWGERGRGGEKGIPPPTVPYFSHSLAVSFPASAFENERLVHRLKRLERLGKDDRSVT